MRHSHFICLIVLTACGCNDPTRSPTNDTSGTRTTPYVKPTESDNTAVNQRDRDGTTKTPINQNENQNDVNITAEIRKKVVGTEFSTNAKNIKIITQDGQVTLRGPVASEDEKKRIEDIARSIAGESKVDSQLEIERNP